MEKVSYLTDPKTEAFIGLGDYRTRELLMPTKYRQVGPFNSFKSGLDNSMFSNSIKVAGFWASAPSKESTGDGLTIKAVVDRGNVLKQINIALLDGVTPAEGVHDDFNVGQDIIPANSGSDVVLPELLRRNTMMIGVDEGRNGLSITQRMWMNLNLGALSDLKLKQFPVCEASKRPGATGCMITLDPNYIEYTAIADMNVFVLSKTGEINPLMVSNNSIYDRHTVKLIRHLIKSGQARDANNARDILFNKGYYRNSYNHKVNKGVPVCNISNEFGKIIPTLPTIRMNLSSVAAVLFMTDGFTYHLQNFRKGISSNGIVRLVKNMLTDNVGDIYDLNSKSFNPTNPVREREHDDATSFVVTTVDESILKSILSNLVYTL